MAELCVTLTKKSDLSKLMDAGATAFAVGTPEFADRQYNQYTMRDLSELSSLCHKRNVKLNVFVNRMFEEEELDDLFHHLQELKEIQVDGIYFSDMAVFFLAKKLNIEKLCIYDPETMMTNAKDAKKMIQLGCQRVVAAKEITLNEILVMSETCPQMEVMIHGHQCMSYSKRKLLSNYFHYIQKTVEIENREDLSLMESTRNEKMPIVESKYGTAIYSPYILASYSQIKMLADAKIAAFRIDGLFISEEELLDTVKNYQKILCNEKSSEEVLTYMKTKYPQQSYSDGYYYKKTNLVKE